MNSTVANVLANARGLELAQLIRSHIYVPVILGVLAIAVLSLTSALLVARIDRLATLEISKALQTVLSTTEQALQSWADEHQANTRIWANRESIVSVTQQLLNLPAKPNVLVGSAIQQRARKELGPLYGPALYEGFFIISPSGINISSSRDANIGFPSLLKDQESFLNKIWHGETAISLPQRSDVPLPNSNGKMILGRATMFVGAPISDANGAIIAVFTVGEVQFVRDEALWRKDGTPFPVEYTSTPIRKGANIVGAVVTFRDITERTEIDKMKNDFVSTVSHELRTPLTSMRGSLGLVCAGTAGRIPDKALELTTIALKNCERLTYLVNDILDLQKIESGQRQFDLSEQSLNQLIQNAIEANAAFGGQYGVPFNFDPGALDVTVNIDANRLTQILSNLLSNAVKFLRRASPSKYVLSNDAIAYALLSRTKGRAYLNSLNRAYL